VPQTFQLNTWYRQADPARIHALAHAVLRSSGFSFDTLPDPLHSWDLVRLGDRQVWSALLPQSEDHHAFEVKTRIDSAAELRTTLLAAFDRILAYPDLVPAACALTADSADVYPFFTHSFFRGSTPLTIVEVPDDDEAPVVHTHADADYWERAGRALHFVSSATLARVGVDPAAFAGQIRAKPTTVPHGVLFDCGWSGTWPLPAIAGLGP
jgi:hypothetical protein